MRVDAFRRQNIPLDYFSNSKCAQIFSTIQILKRNFGDSFKAIHIFVGLKRSFQLKLYTNSYLELNMRHHHDFFGLNEWVLGQ